MKPRPYATRGRLTLNGLCRKSNVYTSTWTMGMITPGGRDQRMQVTPERVGVDQGAERVLSSCQPRCPVCSGPLVELRAALRCARCYFTICEGCAGDPGDEFVGSGD